MESPNSLQVSGVIGFLQVLRITLVHWGLHELAHFAPGAVAKAHGTSARSVAARRS
jgi:hypothetical protein